eukprot:1176380-Prorocentrum_minimum.AAC.5
MTPIVSVQYSDYSLKYSTNILPCQQLTKSISDCRLGGLACRVMGHGGGAASFESLIWCANLISLEVLWESGTQALVAHADVGQTTHFRVRRSGGEKVVEMFLLRKPCVYESTRAIVSIETELDFVAKMGDLSEMSKTLNKKTLTEKLFRVPRVLPASQVLPSPRPPCLC